MEKGILPLPLFLLGLLWELCFLWSLVFGIDRGEEPLAHALLMLGASLPWLLLVRAVFCGGWRLPLSWVLAGGLCLRVLVPFAGPAGLSDDLHRYVWEGRMQLFEERNNPYLHAPEAFRESHAKDPILEGINHREVPAAYPPACELFLRALARLEKALEVPPLELFRNAFALLELLLLFLVAAWLSRLGVEAGRMVVYALCPLVVVELGLEGHNDALGLCLLLASLLVLGPELRPPDPGGKGEERAGLLHPRILGGGALFGLAVSAKLLPLLLLPWLVRRNWRILVPALLATGLTYLPYLPAEGGGLFAGLARFGEKWRHNESLFALLLAGTETFQALLRGTGLRGGLWDWLGEGWNTDLLSRILFAFCLGLCALRLFLRQEDVLRAAVPLFGVLFALSPTVHPWYLCWVLPFLCLRPCPALLALLALSSLSYLESLRWAAVAAGTPFVPEHFWEDPRVFKTAEYLPFYLLALLSLRRRASRMSISWTGAGS